MMVASINQMTAVRRNLADLVGSRICGPSCVAMALQFFARYPNSEARDNVEWLLVKLSELHRSNVRMICYRTEVSGKIIDIPVDILSNKNKYLLDARGFVLKEAGQKYRPIFSLVRGYDHRGSERLFSDFGLNAGYWDRMSMEDMLRKLEEKALILLSVAPRRSAERCLVISKSEPTQSHVVLVTKVKRDNRKRIYEIMDPAYDIQNGLMPKYELIEDDLVRRLNWRGSWVKRF